MFGDTVEHRSRSVTHWYMFNFKHMNSLTDYNGIIEVLIISVLLDRQN